MEIYALEIQMYTAQKNNKKLKALYEQSLHIKSAIPHPLIMGVIRGMVVYIPPSFIELLLELVFKCDCQTMYYLSCFVEWLVFVFSTRVRWEDAFKRGRVWESSHRLLWGLQKLWWVWKPKKDHMPEVPGPSQHVDEVRNKSFWLSRGIKSNCYHLKCLLLITIYVLHVRIWNKTQTSGCHIGLGSLQLNFW